MMGGGSPQTFSQGGNPAPYIPQAQPQADVNFQNIVNSILGQVGPTGAGSPAGQLYPRASFLFSNYVNPQSSDYQNWAAHQALLQAQNASNMGVAGGQGLQDAGLGILNTAFDPQRALFDRTQQQVLDQSNAASSMAGLGGTPYGASVNANALGNFDVNWQNNLLNRMISGGQAGSSLLQAAPQLTATAGALPFNTGLQLGNSLLGHITNLAQLGNNQFQIPQQLLSNLSNYLRLGQGASELAANTGNLGFQQTAQGIGGLLSGANTLFGSNGLLSGAGGLFGGGSAAGDIAGGLGGGGAGLDFGGITGSGLMDVGASTVPIDAFTAAPAAATGLGDIAASAAPFAAS